MKITKYVVLFLSIMFIGIVAIEQIPGVMVPTAETGHGSEYLMFGLFEISILDDITHLVSGLVGLYALWRGYAMRVKYIIFFGGYYTLDAIFHTLNGFATKQPLIDNLLLNLPHFGISALCFIAIFFSVKRLELK